MAKFKVDKTIRLNDLILLWGFVRYPPFPKSPKCLLKIGWFIFSPSVFPFTACPASSYTETRLGNCHSWLTYEKFMYLWKSVHQGFLDSTDFLLPLIFFNTIFILYRFFLFLPGDQKVLVLSHMLTCMHFHGWQRVRLRLNNNMLTRSRKGDVQCR